jgi:hypothetical protein
VFDGNGDGEIWPQSVIVTVLVISSSDSHNSNDSGSVMQL